MSAKNNRRGYVGVYEFARQTGLALNTIYQRIYLKQIPAEKIGRKWKIKRTVMEAAMKA